MSSLASLSANNIFTEGHLFIVFKMYFDGSGKDDAMSPHLTLAGFAAHEDDWKDFENAWAQVLGDHPLKPTYMHMAEAIHLNCAFQRANGWTLDSVLDLTRSLNRILVGLSRNRFCAFRYTVEMDAYRYWRNLANLPRASEQCSLDAFCQTQEWILKSDIPMGIVEVVYDRSEGFLRYLHAHWTSRKSRARWPILRKLNTVAAADAHLTPGLQAADMIAWSANRLWAGPRDPEIDKVCEELLAEGLGTWHCDLDARYLQNEHGLIKLPVQQTNNPVEYIKANRSS